MEKDKKIWIVSSVPPSTEYAEGSLTNSDYVFKEEIDIKKLNKMMVEFSVNIDKALDGVEKSSSKFEIDAIEIYATMAVDGKLGILGSSVGAKAEGSIKFTFKKK